MRILSVLTTPPTVQAGKDTAISIMGYESRFTMSMIMLVIGFFILGAFALVLAKRVRDTFKTEKETKKRFSEVSCAYEESVLRAQRDPLLNKLLNKAVFEEDLKSRSKQPENSGAYMSMDIQGFKAPLPEDAPHQRYGLSFVHERRLKTSRAASVLMPACAARRRSMTASHTRLAMKRCIGTRISCSKLQLMMSCSKASANAKHIAQEVRLRIHDIRIL